MSDQVALVNALNEISKASANLATSVEKFNPSVSIPEKPKLPDPAPPIPEVPIQDPPIVSPPGTAQPVFVSPSDIQVINVTHNSAQISWNVVDANSNLPLKASGQIIYGLAKHDLKYKTPAQSIDHPLSFHKQSLPGKGNSPLEPDTQYYYRILGQDASSGARMAKRIYSFKTSKIVVDIPSNKSPVEDNLKTFLKSMTYKEIEDSGFITMRGHYDTEYDYVGTFALQNPDVGYWENTGTSIRILPKPMAHDAISLPAPTGGNDTKMVHAFVKKHKHKDITGNGLTYKLNKLKITFNCRLFDFKVIPTGGAGAFFEVYAPKVLFSNVLIDCKYSTNCGIGWHVFNNGHEFELIDSEYKNVMNKSHQMITAVGLFGGPGDYRIAGCNFSDIFNASGPKHTSRANGIWINGRMTKEPSRGGVIIANNFERMKSTGTLLDAEAITHQAHGQELGFVYVLGNTSRSAGKRFAKCQSGHIYATGNYTEWMEDMSKIPGVLYNRLTMFTNHGWPAVIHKGNRVVIGGTRYWDYCMQISRMQKTWIPIDSCCDYNHITINTTSRNHKSGHQVLCTGVSWWGDSTRDSKNCSMKGNLIDGTGDLGFHSFIGKYKNLDFRDNVCKIPHTRGNNGVRVQHKEKNISSVAEL